MKVQFEFDNEANDYEVLDRFEVMEFMALTKDTRFIKFMGTLVRLQNQGLRRNRTKAEREQRAVIMGFDSYKDICK